MAASTFSTVDELKAAVGSHLGYSEWWEITQERVNRFADATDDHQFIHVDPDRAAQSPFGGPIAHGYLTLSMAVPLAQQIVSVEGVRMAVNYGTNKVRFPAPVPVGSKLRAGAVLRSVEDVPGGVQVVYELTFEVEGGEKPVCVAETVSRYYL
ncbi:MAG TPA: MaoC family dehydratase [Acidimicrobiia bacterium]|nr:MaoC family dehydratase [Acidimicrobiia bacterium]